MMLDRCHGGLDDVVAIMVTLHTRDLGSMVTSQLVLVVELPVYRRF